MIEGMIPSRRILFAAMLAGLLAGCASPIPVSAPSYVVLLNDPDGGSGKVMVKGSKGSQMLERAGEGAELDGAKAPFPVDDVRLRKDFGAAMDARPAPAEHFQLYFELGGAKLTAESAALLPRIAEAVRKRAAPDISITGHTDTLGSAEKNRELGMVRARATAELLGKVGRQVRAISVESHGEGNLLVKTPDDTAEPRNRRVEITIR